MGRPFMEEAYRSIVQSYFNNDPKADKIRGIQSDIRSVQDIMMENIGTVQFFQ